VILLDRDGTVIVERNYLSNPCQVELIPGAARGLRHLAKLGAQLVVVTNQSGVGRGFFSMSDVDLVHQRLRELLEMEQVYLSGLYVCPHKPDDVCGCRKPRPGLVHLAAKELEFDPTGAFVVGDKECDIDLGRAVGATTFLVGTGYGGEVYARGGAHHDYFVEGLPEAATTIERLLAERREMEIHGINA
jgi:D-glycero-D-manno-heptose 1,7-bisphosphate phosphatase